MRSRFSGALNSCKYGISCQTQYSNLLHSNSPYCYPLTSYKDYLHVLYKLNHVVVWYVSFMFLCFSFFCGNIVKWHKNATDVHMFRVKIGRQEMVHMSKSCYEYMLICLCHELCTTYSFLQCNSPQCILPASFGTCAASCLLRKSWFSKM